MPKIVVTAFRDTGVPASLGTDPVTPARNQILIDTILIRVDLLTRVALRYRVPHRFARRFVPIANGETERLGVLKRPG